MKPNNSDSKDRNSVPVSATPEVDRIINEIYITRFDAEIDRFLAAEDSANIGAASGVPAQVSIKVVSPTRAKILLKSFRRAEVTDAMACANLSLSDAMYLHPQLFEFL